MHGGKNTRDGRPPDSGKPIRRALNKYTFATAVLSSATPLFLGYDLAVAYSMAVTAGADLKLLSCTVALSSLLGAVAATAARRLIGDRRAVLLASAALFTGALARGGPAAALFTTGAIVNGVGTGLALAAVPACAADLSPQSARGALASHPDGLLYLGCILGSLCCNVLKLNLPPRATWQVVMISVASCVAGPALLLGSVVLLLPESPRWLVATDRASEARRMIAATSATLEEAELRFLEINDEVSVEARSWWTEEWRELVARPTEPLRRAVVTALVAKVFQQASVAQYVYRAFRDAGLQVVPRALAAFGFVAVVSLSASLVVVELGLQLVRAALAGGCGMSQRAHSHHVMTRRQEEVKWARGLSATMLLSLVALGWVALGPARWEDDAWCPPWMSATAAAVNSAVSSAILALFVRVDEFSAAYDGLLACPAVVALVWLCFCVCLLGATRR